MARQEPKFHEAGIYLMRNRKTGASYVGASCHLTSRLNAHRCVIVNRPASAERKFLRAFPKLADVEFRILEFIEVPTTITTTGQWTGMEPELRHLYTREAFWIDKLKPSLNVVRRAKNPIVLASLPVGPPEVA